MRVRSGQMITEKTIRASRNIALCLIAFLAALTVDAQDQKANSTREPKFLVVLGDSLAAGYGLDPDEAFPALLQKKISATGWNVEVVNAGVSGDTTSGGLRRLDWLLKRKIDVLLIELGGNDGLRGISVELTRTNLQNMVSRTRQKYPGVEIVLSGMQMPSNMGETYNKAYAKIFPDLATEQHLSLIPFLLEGVGGKRELNQADQIHPTAAGHKIVAENVWKVLEPVLKRLNSR